MITVNCLNENNSKGFNLFLKRFITFPNYNTFLIFLPTFFTYAAFQNFTIKPFLPKFKNHIYTKAPVSKFCHYLPLIPLLLIPLLPFPLPILLLSFPYHDSQSKQPSLHFNTCRRATTVMMVLQTAVVQTGEIYTKRGSSHS